MPNHEELRVWKSAHRLTLDIYMATASWPSSERYGLTSQTRRASASIGANIAEGAGRDSDAEMKRFLRIAVGSANEVHTYLLLARDLGYRPTTEVTRLTTDVIALRRQLRALIRALDQRSSS